MKVNKKLVATLSLLILANIIFFLTVWLLSQYDRVYFDQFLYTLKSASHGAQRSIVASCVVTVGLLGAVFTLLEILLYFIFSGKFEAKFNKYVFYTNYCKSSICSFIKKSAFPFALAGFVFALTLFIFRLDVIPYVGTTNTESDFIEDNYVDPFSVNLTFPEKKRNLIYIFLESMESSYADPECDDRFEENHIPELSMLAENNVSFSHKDGIGGALPFAGTTWTAAAMVSQTSGVTVKVSITDEGYEGKYGYMPGVVSIGEVLGANGYEQVLLVGSDARFGSRASYFTEHGAYKILDTISLKEAGRLPEDYDEWWGFEDEKLFEFAKEELTALAESGKPFNLTMLTADTHFPDGYACELCPEVFEDQYSNVLSCSSRQVNDFINWIKEQPFYKNTTIVLAGDHLTMDPEYMEDITEGYQRTTYNCIINSPIEPIKEKNRLFGNFDLFPTTLAAMGVNIEGDRLGLGTNLFSDKQTLTEKLGFEELDRELQKKSELYSEKILKDECLDTEDETE